MKNKKESEEINKALDSLSAWSTEFTFGWRLQHIRNKRGLTQQALGTICGFTEKGADLRIRQYELNLRHPKDNVLEMLSNELRISREMLSGESNDLQTILFIHILWADIIGLIDVFSATKFYEMMDDDMYRIETRVDDTNVPAIVPSKVGPLLDWMNDLCDKHRQYEAGAITHEQLLDWEYMWPHSGL